MMAFIRIILLAVACSSFVSGDREKRGLGYILSKNGNTVEIVGGSEIIPNSWPFLVVLSRPGYDVWCGGSIIDPEFILTAAHCVYGFSSDVKVTAGEHNINLDEGMEQKRNVSKIIVHPKYEGGSSSIVPQSVDVQVISNEECSKSPSSYYQNDIFKSSICAGTETGGKDSCQGDSGGPFVCRKKGQSRERFHVGTVSWGVGCARSEYPGVYARTSSFDSWIRKTMASN